MFYQHINVIPLKLEQIFEKALPKNLRSEFHFQ